MLYFINIITAYTLLKMTLSKTKKLNNQNIVSIEKYYLSNQTYNSTKYHDFPSFNKFLENKNLKNQNKIIIL